MANTVKDAIEEIQEQVRAITGIRKAPTYPEDATPAFPFVFAYPSNGYFELDTPESMKGLHSIALEFHVARKDLERDCQTAWPYVDSIPKKLFAEFKTNTFSTIETFSAIRYEFGPLSWAGMDTLGFIFTMEDVKIHAAVST